MAGSSFGEIFRISTWGESHGAGLGVVLDGCPAGIPLTEEDIMPYMERRRPNGGKFSTARNEADRVRILSGVFEGKTTGTPISMMLENTDQRSHDYSEIMDVYRPGHADFGYDVKYGFRDYRGGGRASARETSARVAAGAVAQKLLQMMNITVSAECTRIGDVDFSDTAAAEALIADLRARQNSVGSTVVCTVRGLPAGLGEPVFDKLDALLAQAIFSIGAVKGLDIGDGSSAAHALGNENNDPFRMSEGRVTAVTNHAGGILGGISTGADINLTVYFKPTPSISLPQETVDRFGNNTTISIKGRHDPVIGPRAAVVVECMTALVLADTLLRNMTARADRIVDFYRNLSH